MSTAPVIPPRPYDDPVNPLPVPPLPPNILDESRPHFEQPLIAPTPHHPANVRETNV